MDEERLEHMRVLIADENLKRLELLARAASGSDRR